jgi:hypothetical protein
MVAGVLGAVGNNAKGITGVAWKVRQALGHYDFLQWTPSHSLAPCEREIYASCDIV